MDGTANNDEPQQFQPGQTITPGQVAAPAQTAVVSQAAAPDSPAVAVAAVPEPPQPELVAPVAPLLPPADDADTDESVSWTASEFIVHHKTPGWYLVLAAAAAALAIIVWFLTKDYFSVAVVILGAILFGIYAARQPRQVPYRLDAHELTIGTRRHTLHEFRSFSIVPEGAFSSIVLTPLKRFGLFTTIYYDPSDEPKIIDLLSRQLPHEERRSDPIDQLMRRIRF